MARKKKTRPHSSKKKVRRWFILSGVIFLLMASLTATGYFIFLRPGQRTIPPGVEKTPTALPRPPVKKAKPKVAIVIDDMGYRKIEGDILLNINLNLSFSFLPFAPHSTDQAHKAQEKGRDVLLHLPLEPYDPTWDLGPGGLYISMSRKELRSAFVKDLAFVPMAIGVNNHMGSRFCENRPAMRVLLEIVREKNLFFLDSLTSSKSVGYTLAKSMGIRTERRNIFLDNEADNGKIGAQFEALFAEAEKNGQAIGLAHPHPATLETLKEFQHRLGTEVNLVGISELMR